MTKKYIDEKKEIKVKKENNKLSNKFTLPRIPNLQQLKKRATTAFSSGQEKEETEVPIATPVEVSYITPDITFVRSLPNGKGQGLAIAFGSGGARALGSLGVMTVLRKHGIRPVAVSGSSMGAVIAAYYGIHGETETLREWYETKHTRDYLAYMTRPKSGSWVNTQKLQTVVDEFIAKKKFEDTIVPVRIVATNLRTGEEKVFKSGPLIDAIMASVAIPGVIRPHKIGNEYFVDGGVVNPTPVDVFEKGRYAHTLAIDFHFQIPERLESPGMFDVAMRSFQIAAHTAFEHHVHEYRKHCTLITPNTLPGYEALRFDKSHEHILRGEHAARQLIKEWKKNGMYQKLKKRSTNKRDSKTANTAR